MSEETKLVSLSQLDEMLDASVKMAEMQAADYIQRGMQSMGTHVLRTAIEQRDRQRAQFLERARQQAAEAQQPAAQQPAAQPAPAPAPAAAEAVQPATNPLAAPGTPLPANPMESRWGHIAPGLRSLIPPTVLESMLQQAMDGAGADPRSNPNLSFALKSPRRR